MKKKIILILVIFFIAIIATFFIWLSWGYVRDKDPNKTFLLPRLELSQVDITSLTSEKTEMTVNVLIKNQIPLSFTADSLQYRIFIDDKEVMKDHYKKSITLKSNDISRISLPITIFNSDLISILKANERENIDSVEYRFRVSFFTDILFKKQFDVDIKKFLPLIHIPEVKSGHIEISSLNFSGAVFQLIVSIKNQNEFSIKSKNIAYELSIEDNKLIKGIIPGLTDIHAKSVTELTIPVTISFKEVSKTLFDLLKKGNNVGYKLHLSSIIVSENNMMKNSKVILESEGSVKSLMKALKK
ncbi:LEA type 2 family protein [Flavobacterium sp. UBA6031]|uniref:NDR1/HIN1-like protein n=1 Tax=Flavobacterium sp. UBA6031 TaxID=1946551 RepID=UPI0025BF909D|nr:LEA type 2 family protein [Flavobacterium sp. UBA6031]